MVDLLPTTILGRTGLVVTRLGIGGAYAATPEPYRQALDCGVNYVDTARLYLEGKNESVIGEAIAGRRHDLVLATKTIIRDAVGARKELEISLHDLGTDYLDIWQMHGIGSRRELETILAPGGAMETAFKAREQGLVRFIGVTGHDWQVLTEVLKTGLFDTVLCWYNCAMREPEGLVFPVAAQHGTGVVLMSTARGGQLYARPGTANPPDDTDFYRYVLGHPTVDVALMGLRDINRFRRTADDLRQKLTLNELEKDVLEVYGYTMRVQNRLDMPF
ncbi:MAG: aldo/keto reductase [Anaerolineae bacterium]